MATHWTLGCDAADPQRIAAFWAQALRHVLEPGVDEPDNASIIDPDGRGPAIGFLRVPEGKTAKNRVHIDIRVAGEPPWDPAVRERLVRERVAELAHGLAEAVTCRDHGRGAPDLPGPRRCTADADHRRRGVPGVRARGSRAPRAWRSSGSS